MTRNITITVGGIAQPQGSKNAFPVKLKGGGVRCVVVDANSKSLTHWRTQIANAARDEMSGDPLFDGPLGVIITINLPRPQSRAKRHHYPDRRPDWEKLARAAGDALTGVVWTDDARIVTGLVGKRYAGDIGGTAAPGVVIEVFEWPHFQILKGWIDEQEKAAGGLDVVLEAGHLL